ncbi:MAG: NfeD family protein [Desulfurococcaceae archaeon]
MLKLIAFTRVLSLSILILFVIMPVYYLEMSGQSETPLFFTRAVLIDITPPWDTIDEGVKECFIDALRYAEGINAVLIYRVNSYGGYLDSAFGIGDSILYAKVPVIAYVENKALSAGTLIILPADFIALQKNSIIGAMQPVMVNPATGEIVFLNESKVINPIIEKARVYANKRGRNISLIEEFILRSKVVNSRTAVDQNIGDIEVEDLDELIEKLRDLELNVSGITIKLSINRRDIQEFSCSLRSRFLSILSNSYLANVLLSIGVLATIFALVSGRLVVLPISIAMILLGLIGTGINPNMVSTFLVLLGAILLAIELFVLPGFGIVGISGVVLLTLGLALLPVYIPTGALPPGEYIMALRVFIIGTALILGSVFGLAIYKVVEVKRKKPIQYTPVGKIGRAVESLEPGKIGFIKVEGEYWRAISDENIQADEYVVVIDIRDDGVLIVKRKRIS